MSQISIKCTGTYTLLYDEESPEFKEALEGYQKCIEKGGTKQSMLQHVAFYINRFGISSMVEGVGYVKRKGWEKIDTEEPWSGIIVEDPEPDFEFEIL